VRRLSLVGLLALVACGQPVRSAVERAAIRGGTDESGQPAVVALLDGDEVVCSGTLVARHSVLTAAHCIAGAPDLTRLRVFFGQSPAAGGTRAEVTRAEIHPAFNPRPFANDLGLVTLRRAGPAEPVPLDARTLDAALIGQPFVVAGFGVTAPGASDADRKRSGPAQVGTVEPSEFTNTPASTQPCTRDSGGPALFTVNGAVVVSGVASHGDAACADHTSFARLDVARDAFLAPALAATADGSAAAGARCYHDDHCAGAACLTAPDDARLAFCAPSCDEARPCPPPLTCTPEGCRHPTPSPGALGAACADAADCEDRTCYRAPDEAGGLCTRRCLAVGQDCPDGLVCQNVAGTQFYCLPPPGGCQAAPARPPPFAPVVLLLALLLRRRRRA
jgi:uncharacterized protein (TIGR03382 family)